MNPQEANKLQEPRTVGVTGHVRFADGTPAPRTEVAVFDRALRSELRLGQEKEKHFTDNTGGYRIEYTDKQFLDQEDGTPDLVVKAIDVDGSVLASSAVIFSASMQAEIDLTIPRERKTPPPLFERIGAAVTQLLDKVKIEDLEEDQKLQDLSFLSKKTELNKRDLVRFALAHRLAQHGIEAEFWFVLLGGSFFKFVDTQSLKAQLEIVTTALPSLDVAAVRKTLARGFNLREIADHFRKRSDDWIEAFLKLVGH